MKAFEPLSDVVQRGHTLPDAAKFEVWFENDGNVSPLKCRIIIILTFNTFVNSISSVAFQQPISTKRKPTVKKHRMMLTL